MQGIELAKDWFETAGLPAIREKCPDALPFLAAGLAGSGSECFGFDDEISRDHDFSVRFSLWLPEKEEARFGFRLERIYAGLRKEAPSPGGKTVSKKSAWGQPGGGVDTIESFFLRHIGIPGAPRHWEQWLRIPEYAFAEAVNGAVFQDGPGTFTSIRNTILTGMPQDVLLKKLAARTALMAQSGQYNFVRCLKHGERGAAHLALAEFVRTAGSMIHLLNGSFPPYYKWLLKSLRKLAVLGDMADPLEFLLADEAPDDVRQDVVEDICRRIASVLRERSLSDSRETFLEAHAVELMKRIENREIRSLHIMEG